MKPMTVCLCLLCLSLSGCLVPSLHPFYSDATLVTEPNLVGVWSGDKVTWTFTAAAHKDYQLNLTQGDKSAKLDVHLFKLGDDLYMDLYPQELPKDLPLPDIYKLHLLPVHNVVHVVMDKDHIKGRILDLDKMKSLLKAYPQLLHHELVDNVVVLTDSPEAIETFLRTFHDYPALWSKDGIELTRQPGADPNQSD